MTKEDLLQHARVWERASQSLELRYAGRYNSSPGEAADFAAVIASVIEGFCADMAKSYREEAELNSPGVQQVHFSWTKE